MPGAKGEGKFFSSPNDAINAYDYGVIDFRAMVKVLATDTEKYAQFDSKACSQVIEFGPINASIHKIDEHVLVSSIDPLKNIYKGVLERLAGLTEIAAS